MLPIFKRELCEHKMGDVLNGKNEEEFTIKINHEEYLNFKYVSHFLSYSLPFFTLPCRCCAADGLKHLRDISL